MLRLLADLALFSPDLPMNRKLILLVADELYVTSVIAQQLRPRGFEVAVASDGAEALALIKERRPDLIVSDYQMPQITGMEMAARLCDDPATMQIPIIMLTAREHCLNASELAQTNIRAFMAKPFSIKQLLGNIERLLTAGMTDSPPLRRTA